VLLEAIEPLSEAIEHFRTYGTRFHAPLRDRHAATQPGEVLRIQAPVDCVVDLKIPGDPVRLGGFPLS
jgi:hypothetical protein